MGRSYRFECPTCNYRAIVSGGLDRGFRFFTRTMECLECRELLDVVIRVQRVSMGRPPCSNLMRRNRPVWEKELRAIEIKLGLPPYSLVMSRQKTRLPEKQPEMTLLDAPFQWLDIEPRCPAGELHELRPWQEPGPCPRCSNYLERSLIPSRFWE